MNNQCCGGAVCCVKQAAMIEIMHHSSEICPEGWCSKAHLFFGNLRIALALVYDACCQLIGETHGQRGWSFTLCLCLHPSGCIHLRSSPSVDYPEHIS